MSSDLGEFVWRYIHTHDPVGRLIRLSSDGRIVGSEHPNEYYWELEDSCLIFKSIDHQKSVVFNLNDSPLGRDIINGKFVLIPGLGITTQLIKDDKVKVLAIRSAYEAADTVKRLHDSIDVSYTETHYGGRDYHSDSYLSHAFDLLTFHNAEIINKYGVIKCDQILIDESLFHFPFFQEKQILKISDACAGYAPKQASLKFGSALNAALGISGNYYHWMIFFIARMGLLAASEPARKNYTILLPDYLDPVQRQSAEVVAAHYGIPIARICDGTVVEVDELLFPYQRYSFGVDPHPAIMATFAIIKRELSDAKAGGAAKIYITRADSNFRKLDNEAEVEKFLTDRGFQIVRFTGLSLSQQIAIMANARFIVAPHGAGLTNIVFANPGARLLELHSPNHIAWCMKNLATLTDVEYGFVMGQATDGDRYRVDMDEVRAAVSDMGA
ncbi:glycosyltransferase family 61 protein [Methylobacterium variabile]|nr:glycosyltransferase family 61 protein [Methylobacterium variabile]